MKSLTQSREVYWLFTLTVHPGQEDLFRAISARLVASTGEEEGCLNYEWSLTGDGRTCHIYERYIDSAAVKIHRQRNGSMVGELLAVATPVSFVFYGAPDDEVKEMLASRSPLVMQPLGGFAR